MSVIIMSWEDTSDLCHDRIIIPLEANGRLTDQKFNWGGMTDLYFAYEREYNPFPQVMKDGKELSDCGIGPGALPILCAGKYRFPDLQCSNFK